MSGDIREITFTVTTEDPERWSAASQSAAEADGGYYSDWVIEQIGKKMRDAGNAFIAEHPDLFRSTELG